MSVSKKSSKQIISDIFCEKLKSLRISYKRHNTYHVQVDSIHNFYPSRGTYYNSATEHKCKFPDFEKHSEVVDFLRENGATEIDMDITYPAYKIVEILKDCEHLDDAIQFFNNH